MSFNYLAIAANHATTFLNEVRYLFWTDEIAIIIFDKGMGMAGMPHKGLDERKEAEYDNVTMDTKHTTKALQTKIQDKLRELHEQD